MKTPLLFLTLCLISAFTTLRGAQAGERCREFESDQVRMAWGRQMSVMRTNGADCKAKTLQLEYFMGRIENPSQPMELQDLGIWVRSNGISRFFAISSRQRCPQGGAAPVMACQAFQPISRGGFAKVAILTFDRDSIETLFGDVQGEIEFAVVVGDTWDSQYGRNYRAFPR